MLKKEKETARRRRKEWLPAFWRAAVVVNRMASCAVCSCLAATVEITLCWW